MFSYSYDGCWVSAHSIAEVLGITLEKLGHLATAHLGFNWRTHPGLCQSWGRVYPNAAVGADYISVSDFFLLRHLSCCLIVAVFDVVCQCDKKLPMLSESGVGAFFCAVQKVSLFS